MYPSIGLTTRGRGNRYRAERFVWSGSLIGFPLTFSSVARPYFYDVEIAANTFSFTVGRVHYTPIRRKTLERQQHWNNKRCGGVGWRFTRRIVSRYGDILFFRKYNDPRRSTNFIFECTRLFMSFSFIFLLLTKNIRKPLSDLLTHNNNNITYQ